jgi:hypothetical protein
MRPSTPSKQFFADITSSLSNLLQHHLGEPDFTVSLNPWETVLGVQPRKLGAVWVPAMGMRTEAGQFH